MMDERQVAGSHETAVRPAAFLDRDGVINVDYGYVHRVEDLVLTPTAADGIRLLNDAGYRVIVATNQSGVARGYFGIEDVERFHSVLSFRLESLGARIDAFYFCPYHPEGKVAQFSIDHSDRKPHPGMLLRALKDWPTDRDRSFFIGDRQSDMMAADGAGIFGILVAKDSCDLAAVVRDQLRR